ncbi:hypothetical protein ASPWEDRAFT_25686 [Aspergillus wentii DTO 134E9]|uniref:Integral membrane protein n=1 Tax=Aspergillus wentii DTO 134E9 TaxID=1073089 RepID=A0A1L9RYD7_ASPWE|nr:uncharacterized protein ASPWEDRAFT_25686 [Aspergillus wentii DTO 134E9]KAI9931435.1 hypothetical protein MW887_010010 [Aspergillus wentii]OJJ39894.1 hypothetical protein ASPWEDRAFT_25686 [Aspergillus wentii DTO 134E9]
MQLARYLEFNRGQKRLLISFGVVYLLVVFFCFSNSARDPGSIFFRPSHGYRPEYSAKRVDEALKYVSAFNQSSTHSNQSLTTEGVEMCIGIVTVKRPLVQNLDVTVGSLLDGLSPEQRSAVSLQVLFAPTNAWTHPDYGQPWVPNIIDRVLTYEDFDAPITDLMRLERKHRIAEKSLVDYRLALNSCYNQTDAPWILMVEDDVVAQKKWYDHTMQSLETIKDGQRRGAIYNWFYLRLFYTEKFLGWNDQYWPTYLFWSLVVVTIPGTLLIYARRNARSIRGTLTNPFLFVVCFGCIPMFIILFFLAGRVTLQPMKPGVHLMNRNGCCSQALLFPRKNVPPLMEYLRYRQDKIPKPVDSVIEAFANDKDFDRFVISPSQMQHVGASSYKKKQKTVEAQGPYLIYGAHGVWSMGFEKAYQD